MLMKFGSPPQQQEPENPLAQTAKGSIKVLEVLIKQGLAPRPIVVAAGLTEGELHGAFGQWQAVPANAQQYAGKYLIVDVPFVGDL